MIDQHFLQDGVILNETADYIEQLEEENKRLRELVSNKLTELDQEMGLQ